MGRFHNDIYPLSHKGRLQQMNWSPFSLSLSKILNNGEVSLLDLSLSKTLNHRKVSVLYLSTLQQKKGATKCTGCYLLSLSLSNANNFFICAYYIEDTIFMPGHWEILHTFRGTEIQRHSFLSQLDPAHIQDGLRSFIKIVGADCLFQQPKGDPMWEV